MELLDNSEVVGLGRYPEKSLKVLKNKEIFKKKLDFQKSGSIFQDGENGYTRMTLHRGQAPSSDAVAIETVEMEWIYG